MTLIYQRFTAMLLLIYGSLFLSGIYYCLSACVLVCRRENVGAWICQDVLERQDDILGRVITGDETWVYQYDWNEAAKCTMEDCQFRRSSRDSKQCCWLFFILEGLFIMNLQQLHKQSTKFIVWKSWKGCVKNLDGNDPKFWPTTHVSCITTMHLLTQHSLWGSF